MPVMAKVTIHRPTGNFTVEDLTFEQVKELVGVNGYGSHSAHESPVSIASSPRSDYQGFLEHLSDRGKLFVNILKHHPMGIEANELAGKLSFNDARQIGGLTGGGVAKAAKKCSINLRHVYRTEIIRSLDGKRKVTFYPGKLVLGGEQEKPAI